jgi:tRNA G37 N-methylase TrmD
LSGGELAAAVVVDAVARLRPDLMPKQRRHPGRFKLSCSL